MVENDEEIQHTLALLMLSQCWQPSIRQASIRLYISGCKRVGVPLPEVGQDVNLDENACISATTNINVLLSKMIIVDFS